MGSSVDTDPGDAARKIIAHLLDGPCDLGVASLEDLAHIVGKQLDMPAGIIQPVLDSLAQVGQIEQKGGGLTVHATPPHVRVNRVIGNFRTVKTVGSSRPRGCGPGGNYHNERR